jgi:FMN phosphatase YigB (HAD superfamily)
MIKAVLFDAGGVLHYSHATVEQEIQHEFNLSAEQVHELFWHYEPLIGTGKMTEHELWMELHEKWGIREVARHEKIFTRHFEKSLKKFQEYLIYRF